MNLAEVLIITVPCLLVTALVCYLVYRVTVLERVLANLLATIESQGTTDDDMECLHVVMQAARKLVGR